LVLGITVLILVGGYLSVRREKDLFMTDMEHDDNLFGQSVKGLVSDVLRISGEAKVKKLVDDLNERHFPMHIRLVLLNADPASDDTPMAPLSQLAPVLEGRDFSVVGRNPQEDQVLLTYVPLEMPNSQLGALEISESLSSMSDYIHTTVARTLGITGAMVVLSITLVAISGYRVVGHKLEQLAKEARAIGEGNLTDKIHLKGHDELTELGLAMNAMSEQLLASKERERQVTAARIAALIQLRHEDRLRTVGRLASGLAHELGTPLNVVSGHAGLIAAGSITEKEVVDSAGIIRSQTEKMTALIKQLLNFSRKSTLETEESDINQLTRQTLDLLQPLSQKQNTSIRLISNDSRLLAMVNASQFQQVLINIISNAFYAVTSAGEIEIHLGREQKESHNDNHSKISYIKIEIKDNGSGIPEEDLPHLFEPFFTTKDVGEGTGLGLSIAYGIIKEYNGWIEVTSEQGKGSRFSVYIPEEVKG